MDMRLQHGFTLTEVLVTLLVLNIGLLGVLAAQTLALKQVRDATYRTQALALGNALVQEMQSNSALANVIGTRLHLQSEIPAAPECSPTQPCTAGQVAAVQLQQWFELLKPEAGAPLPEAEFCLQQSAGAVSLAVSWRSVSQTQQGRAQGCQPGAGRSHFVIAAG